MTPSAAYGARAPGRRRPVRALDALLRRAQGIHEVCDDPECLFRVRRCRLARPLGGGSLPRGTRVLELHFWNERLPPLPPDGADFAWGARGQRMLLASLRLIARHVRDTRAREPEAVAAVVGVTAFFSAGEAAASRRLLARLGFSAAPFESRLGRFGAFWENVHARLIMWAFNGATMRGRGLARLHRVVVWMPAEELVRRYAAPARPAAAAPRAGLAASE